jgi:elongation factor Tu
VQSGDREAMTMLNRGPDFEADVELLSTEEGGRRRPCRSGYRPHLRIRAGELVSGAHEYVGTAEVWPGGKATARITLITPEHYERSLSVGMRIPFSEGPRVVGYATVTQILDPRLDAGPLRTLPTTTAGA